MMLWTSLRWSMVKPIDVLVQNPETTLLDILEVHAPLTSKFVTY